MKNNVDSKRYGLEKNCMAVLDGELVVLDEFGGKHAYETDKREPATPEAVFELFNGTMTAVENEANARAAYAVKKYGDVPYAEQNVLKVVETYDELINDSEFELDVFLVRKMDMENFWAANNRKAPFKVSGKAKTYGGSSVYVVRRGKRVVFFLLNNMTYDGQNSYCLTSVKAGKAARASFKGTGRYPIELRKADGTRNRWARVLDELAANGGDITNAWSILEAKDSMFFYGELKKHNGLEKKTRDELNAVRRAAGGKTFVCYVDELESAISQLETARDVLEEKLSDNGANWTEDKREAVENGIRRLDGRIYDKNVELWDLTEEHNSESAVTTMEDY